MGGAERIILLDPNCHELAVGKDGITIYGCRCGWRTIPDLPELLIKDISTKVVQWLISQERTRNFSCVNIETDCQEVMVDRGAIYIVKCKCNSWSKIRNLPAVIIGIISHETIHVALGRIRQDRKNKFDYIGGEDGPIEQWEEFYHGIYNLKIEG